MFLKSGRIVTFLFLLCFFVGAVPPAFSFDLSGNWSYRQNGGDDQETQSIFQQTYQLGVGPALSLQPTSAITVSGGVGYRNTQRDSGNGNGFETVEQVSPYAQMSLINDIFVATASANTFITLAGSETSSSFWNATLGSAWTETYWPNINFNYGEDYNSVSTASLFDASGGKNRNTSVSVDWDVFLADLYYEYNLSERLNGDGDSQSQSTSHYVKLDTGGDFWGNRIRYNLSQQFRQVTTEVNLGDEEDTVIDPGDNIFSVSGQTFFSFDNIPSAVDENIQLNPENLLNNDEVDEVSPTVVAASTRGYFGFRSDFTESVSALYLYLDPDPVIPNAFQLSQLGWALYRKIPNSFPDQWVEVPITGGLQPDFNIVTVQTSTGSQQVGRFEFNVNISDQEFMVVLDNPAGSVPLSFSELDVISQFAGIVGPGTNTATTTSYKTGVGVSYRIAQSLGTSFNVNYEHRESENGAELVSENDKLAWSGRLNWSPSPYFSPSLGYSEYLETRTGKEDFRSTAYSLSASSRLLPSLNVSFGLTHNELFRDNETTDISSIFSLSSQIKIYPDLTVSLSSSYSDADRLVSDVTNDRTFFVNTKSISSRLDIVARLTRKLVTYVSTNHSTSESDTGGTRESVDSTVRLNYRPSDILSLQSSYSMFFGDNDRTNSLNNSIDLYLLRTYKTRLSLSATHVQADEALYGLRMLGSWDISDYFSLSTTGDYSMGPVNSYSFRANLVMRL